MLLAATMGIAACSTDDSFYEPNAATAGSESLEEMIFAVSMENCGSSLSKASLTMDALDNMRFSFTSGDQLSVFSSKTMYTLDYAGVVNGTGSFAGNLSGSTFYALFPYQADAAISDNIITANIATEIDGSKNADFNPGIISVALASSSSRVFNLKNACSLLWLEGNLSEYSKIEVESNKGIAGKVAIEVSDKTPVISTGSAFKITISNPSSPMVAVAPVSDANINITFYRKDGSSFVRKYTNMDLERSQVSMLQAVDGHLAKFDIGVDGAEFTNMMVSENSDFVLPDNNGIVNGGLNFVGWKDASGTVYPQGSVYKMGSQDISLTAEWSSKYVLTYNVEGDRAQKYVLFDDGETFTLEAAPEREGYRFKGWLSNGTEYNVGSVFKPIGNTLIYAVYEANKYLITVDANGGAFQDLLVKKATCLFNQTLDLGSAVNYPTRDGYDFGGYYDNPEFNGSKITSISNPVSDMTLYARWYKVYTISYVYPNGEPVTKKDGTPLTQTYSENTYCIEIAGVDDYLDYEKWFIPECIIKDAEGNEYKQYQRVNVSALDDIKDIVLTISDAEEM